MNTPRLRRDSVGLLLAGAVALIGFLGIALVLFGSWRPSPGGNPWLVPLLAFLTLLPTSAIMARAALTARSGPTLPRPAPLPIIVGAIWAVVFFLLVRWLGLFSGTLLAMAVAMWCLTPAPRPKLRIALLALLAGVAFWLLFTQLAPIVLPTPWLF